MKNKILKILFFFHRARTVKDRNHAVATSSKERIEEKGGFAYNKLPPEFLELSAGWRRQVSTAATASNASAADASGASTSASGPGRVLPAPQLLELSRQLLHLRHRQWELLLLLVEQRPYAVQVRGCEHEETRQAEEQGDFYITTGVKGETRNERTIL